MKKYISKLVILVVVFALTLSRAVFAAFDSSWLTWDSASATLSEIASKLGYSMVDKNGDYDPMYYPAAIELWKMGVMKGSNGVFLLEDRLTRAEGIALVLRILGKEEEAKNSGLVCPFDDVPQWAQPYVAYAAKHGIASGYSSTKFGAKDFMTANHYLTFILRALGYSDKDGDFVWNKAAEKAYELGIIGESCKEQYMRSNLFLRDNAAVITSNALWNKTKDGRILAEDFSSTQPDGPEPYATMAAKLAAEAAAGGNTDTGGGTQTGGTELPNVVNYANFAVPDYAALDANAKGTVIKEESDKYFLAYSVSEDKTDDYADWLDAAGFSRRGSINFEPKNYTTLEGGLIKIGTIAYVCEWYCKDEIHVVFGGVRDQFIVRIFDNTGGSPLGGSGLPTPDQLRIFSVIMTKNY